MSTTESGILPAVAANQPATNASSQGRLILPVFSFSVIIYALGLLLGTLASTNHPARIAAIAASIALFFGVTYGLRHIPGLAHYGLPLLVLGLAITAVFTLPVVDDFYLRNNTITDRIIDYVNQFLPKIGWLQMHRNNLAGMCAVFGTMAVGLVFMRGGWLRLVSGGSALALYGVLLLTNSRSGFLAMAFGLVLLIGLGATLWWKSGWLRLAVLSGAGLIMAGGIIYLLVSGQYRLFTIEKFFEVNGLIRLDLWRTTLYALGDVPISGFGPGEYQSVYPFYLDPTPNAGYLNQEHAHNLYLSVFSEMGLFSFLGVVVATLTWGTLAWRTALGKTTALALNPPNGIIVVISGLAAFGASLFYSFFDYSTWQGQFGLLFWLPAALIAASLPAGAVPFGLVQIRRRLWSSRPAKAFSLGIAALVVLIIAWQWWGLTILNAGSLTKLGAWKQNDAGLVARTYQLNQQAADIVGWADAPVRSQAWALYKQGKYQQAQNIFQNEVDRNPNDRLSNFMLGEIYFEQGNEPQALKYWARAEAAPILTARGQRWMDTPAFKDRAEKYLVASLSIEPRLWESYAFLSQLYWGQGKIDQALATLSKATTFITDTDKIARHLEFLQRSAPNIKVPDDFLKPKP